MQTLLVSDVDGKALQWRRNPDFNRQPLQRQTSAAQSSASDDSDGDVFDEGSRHLSEHAPPPQEVVQAFLLECGELTGASNQLWSFTNTEHLNTVVGSEESTQAAPRAENSDVLSLEVVRSQHNALTLYPPQLKPQQRWFLSSDKPHAIVSSFDDDLVLTVTESKAHLNKQGNVAVSSLPSSASSCPVKLEDFNKSSLARQRWRVVTDVKVSPPRSLSSASNSSLDVLCYGVWIVSELAPMVLDLSVRDGYCLLWDYNKGANQRWHITSSGHILSCYNYSFDDERKSDSEESDEEKGAHTPSNEKRSLEQLSALEAADDGKHGAQAVIWERTESLSQQWRFTREGYVKSLVSGRVLEAQNEKQRGSAIVLVEPTNRASQKWRVVSRWD